MATETNFTPGPWFADPDDVRDEALAVLDAIGCNVADVFTMCRPGECEANAHLIAAAPELYEALEDCITALELYAPLEDCITALEPCDIIKPRDWKKDRENLRRVYQSARAALAKTRGE